ncbi:hypothetical protein H072_11413 [Dactylellina haptotyla CBS 200.50]|uniref:Uncharacterized protein n=1 Tax=Dactylellina haptotyla (strain CBS 200.50) TaxID=1284197 RepID=S8B812_DACHA|nr:hypothetical protein H072_11413 [Dactylellina haptotyla CBS 200.50]
MRFYTPFFALTAASVIPSVIGHCLVVDTVGDAGRAHGYGLGVNFATPRDGTGTAFQKDVTVFGETTVGLAKGCGKTHMQADRYLPGQPGYDPAPDQPNTVKPMVEKMVTMGSIPMCSAGGYLNVTFHQINGDGAGPFTCMIDQTGMASKFTKITVKKQADGINGANAGALVKNLLIVNIPADVKCTGTFGSKKNVCMIRCQNPSANGPFGACIPFELKVTAPPPPPPPPVEEDAPADEETTDDAKMKRDLTDEQMDFIMGGEYFTPEQKARMRKSSPPKKFNKWKNRKNRKAHGN